MVQVQFDSNLEHVVGLGEDGSLHRWSLGDGQILWSTEEFDGGFEQFELDPSGTMFAVPRESTIELFDTATGEVIEEFASQSQLSLAWIDDDHFVSAGFSGDVSIWEVGAAVPQQIFAVSGGSELLRVDSTRRRLFIGRLDGAVTVWSLDDGRELFTLPAHPGMIIALSLDAAGNRLLSGDVKGVVHVRTLDTLTLVDMARGRVTRGLTSGECLTYGGEDGCS